MELTIEQLPDVLRNKLNETIEKHPTIIALRKKIDKCMRVGDYVGAASARADISRIQKSVEKDYLERNGVMRKRVAAFKDNMTDEDQEKMSINANMIILLADMMETCTVEVNEVVSKYEPEFRVEMFDDIVKLGKACSQQITWMSNQTDMFYQLSFGDVADNISMMVRNKVKSLLRKVYKHNREKKEAEK